MKPRTLFIDQCAVTRVEGLDGRVTKLVHIATRSESSLQLMVSPILAKELQDTPGELTLILAKLPSDKEMTEELLREPILTSARIRVFETAEEALSAHPGEPIREAVIDSMEVPTQGRVPVPEYTRKQIYSAIPNSNQVLLKEKTVDVIPCTCSGMVGHFHITRHNIASWGFFLKVLQQWVEDQSPTVPRSVVTLREEKTGTRKRKL